MRPRSALSAVPEVLSLCLALALLAVPAVSAANYTVYAGGGADPYPYLYFSPSAITIKAGDSITWVNQGGSHNVTADDGSFRCAHGCDGDGHGGDGTVSPGWTFTLKFNTPGTIGYHCQMHGSPGGGMYGTITVQPAPPPPTPGTLRFSQSAYSVSEATANATITVSRVSGDDGAASVNWQAAAGTATAGSDFTAASGVLNWADKDGGDKTFQVHIINDTLPEPTETVLLTLSGATGAALDDAHKSAVLSILDNDSGGTAPPAPTGLTATAVSTSEIDLAWHDVTGETAYHVEKKQLGGSYQEIGTVGANVTGFAATGLSEATFSSFRVRAENGAGFSPYSNEASAATDATVVPCAPSATVLCLNNGRFAAHVHWRTSNSSGDGTAVPLASAPDSGLFYFFSPTNIEMLIKVLNGCPLTAPPPAYWVFYAATTNVEITVTVSDSQTGKTRVYFNPLNTTAPPVQDVSAFATCP